MKKPFLIILAAVLLGITAFGVYKYIDYREYYSSHFCQNTTINKVDCSGMTEKEALKALTRYWNNQEFEIIDDGTSMAVLENLNFRYDIADDLEDYMSQCSRFPVLARLFGHDFNSTIEMKVKADTKSFDSQIDDLSIFDNIDYVQTTNAYVDLSNTDFEVVPEVYGTNVDKETLKHKIRSMIAADQWQLDYVEKDYYAQPTITKDSQEIKDRLEYCNKYLTRQIVYDFGDNNYTLTPKELNRIMRVEDDGTIKVKTKKTKSFVTNLAYKYNTVGSTRSFNSTSRGIVQVYGGTFGYAIDIDSETKQLIKDLKSGKDVEREPVYSQTGNSREGSDIGSTYIEVDIQSQHLWYYNNGSLVVDCDVVTGCVADGTTTVTGTYSIAYLERNATLRGQSIDGEDYESEVDYWMPFYSGYGMHDADWRTEFGGSIYIKGGSHGCVNMPNSAAGALFNSVQAGCPVVVFN